MFHVLSIVPLALSRLISAPSSSSIYNFTFSTLYLCVLFTVHSVILSFSFFFFFSLFSPQFSVYVFLLNHSRVVCVFCCCGLYFRWWPERCVIIILFVFIFIFQFYRQQKSSRFQLNWIEFVREFRLIGWLLYKFAAIVRFFSLFNGQSSTCSLFCVFMLPHSWVRQVAILVFRHSLQFLSAKKRKSFTVAEEKRRENSESERIGQKNEQPDFSEGE